MSIRIELYGRLRDAGLGEAFELDWAGGTAKELLSAAVERIGPAASGAALATETEVLNGDVLVPKSARLALLPPVCGG